MGQIWRILETELEKDWELYPILYPYYFEIAMTLRESMFVNGILTNSDIWYNLKETEIEELESLGTGKSCPKEALFLEIPIGIIIKSRRLNYLHY